MSRYKNRKDRTVMDQHASPCVQICTEEGGMCIGCGRTLDEIQRWPHMSEEEKAVVWERIELE